MTHYLPTGNLVIIPNHKPHEFSAQNWGDQVETDKQRDGLERDVLRVKVKSHYQRALHLTTDQWATINATADKHITKRKQRVKKLQRDYIVDPDPVMASSD